LIVIYEHPEDGPRLVSTTHPKGVPLMVIPGPPECCCCCPCYAKLNVPEGMIILETVWGADNGMMEPGCRCCYWYKF
jgi:hypothetical protein